MQYVCVRACVCVHARVCARACAHACVLHACMCLYRWELSKVPPCV